MIGKGIKLNKQEVESRIEALRGIYDTMLENDGYLKNTWNLFIDSNISGEYDSRVKEFAELSEKYYNAALRYFDMQIKILETVVEGYSEVDNSSSHMVTISGENIRGEN